MTAPVREQLLAALTTAVGGEYRLPSPDGERDLPKTFVQDSTDESGEDYDFTSHVTPVAVARIAEATGTTTADRRAQANEMLAELVQAMYADPTFGGLAQGVDMVGQGVQVELSKFVFAEASFRVRWRHVRGDPWATEVV